MSASIGRLLQIAGMLLLPVGLLYGLVQDNIKLEVRLLFIGAGLFVTGWLLARERQE